ncbi:hypothetical protein [Gramella sp. AN32]|uniref:Uncharacterized protein n=1 Tax=Christiangramia antarctica TaxID=2058158 RepID=A0ABW5X476_9FLAO|nr:hypothetical protein [Gramella sp. AN32]MCM4156304.1 hypothetical protein [Gramella sp. AN32]
MKKISKSAFLLLAIIMLIALAVIKERKTSDMADKLGDIKNTELIVHENSQFPSFIEFNTQGLNYEVELTDIFLGNFEAVPFKREEMLFGTLFNMYVTTYAKYCPGSLPKDKIELTKQECETYQITKNGYGMEISRTCINYRTVGTDLFTTPEMFAAMQVLSNFQLGNTLSLMSPDGGFGAIAKTTGEMKAVYTDMTNLLRMNACDSPGLKRFQENLRRYALNEQPKRLEALIAERKSNKVEISENQNAQQLLEDLVYQNSLQWNFNRFQKGSVHDINILSTDALGRPSKIKGTYTFSGFGGKKRGTVTLTFNAKGMPDCLYFFDFPTTCRPANRKIANEYAKNSYANN